MINKIGIVGSRKLACNLTEWMLTQKSVQIIGIVPPPFKGWWDDQLKKLAEKNRIPVFSTIEELLQETPDVIFSLNYWKVIEPQYIKLVKSGIINIHHSYLLKYKGRYSTSWAIVNARKLNCWQHGTTLHYINERLDEGDIIDSYKCIITEADTAESLFERVENLAIDMFKANFPRIINEEKINYLKPDNDSFFYDINSNKNLEIPYGTNIEEVYDFIRAWTFKDRPKPYFKYNDVKIFLSF